MFKWIEKGKKIERNGTEKWIGICMSSLINYFVVDNVRPKITYSMIICALVSFLLARSLLFSRWKGICGAHNDFVKSDTMSFYTKAPLNRFHFIPFRQIAIHFLEFSKTLYIDCCVCVCAFSPQFKRQIVHLRTSNCVTLYRPM